MILVEHILPSLPLWVYHPSFCLVSCCPPLGTKVELMEGDFQLQLSILGWPWDVMGPLTICQWMTVFPDTRGIAHRRTEI